MKTQSCVDCSFARHSELCYECLNIEKCYSCDYCIDCTNSHDLKYCHDCLGCSDCLGCIGLRHKTYQVYNKQLSKEAYALIARSWASAETFDSARFEQIKRRVPHVNLHLYNSEDCVGDYIYNSKDCYECYDINNMQGCLYYSYGNYNSPDKDCADIDNGSGCELCYDCYSVGYCYNCNFLVHSSTCSDCDFGWNLNNCKSCFGCVYLKGKEYHFLNEPYSKADYERLVTQTREGRFSKLKQHLEPFEIPSSYGKTKKSAYLMG